MASREILSLDTATPQIVAPQTGDTYSAPRAVAISPESLTGSAATTSLDIAQTWNTTGTPTAVKLNVTDTASNAASLLMDLQVGGTSRFVVAKTGRIDFTGDLRANGSGSGIRGLSNTSYFSLGAADDVVFTRDAADTLALRRTTNAQTLRVYKSYTDASNYSRLAINNNQIASEAAGTGTLEVTADAPVLNLAQTWNNAAVTFTGLKANVTDTASNGVSQIIDLQVGGISQFKVRKDGFILINSRHTASNFVGFSGSTGLSTTLIFMSGTGTYGGSVRMTGTQLGIHTAGAFGFTTQANTTDSDVLLERDNAANTLALRNATNAQTFNVYNTYTSSTNYERGFLKWNTNVLQIGTEKGSGGGTARALEFQTDGTTRLTIASGGGVTVQAGFALTCEYLYGPSTRLVLGNNANQLVTIGGFTSSFPALKRVGANLQTVAADDTATAGLIVGNQALATTATDGFLYVPTCAGTPTGTPTARTGTVPIVVDTTNNKLYFYSGAAWRDAGP